MHGAHTPGIAFVTAQHGYAADTSLAKIDGDAKESTVQSPNEPIPIVIVMGISGTGKSTVAEALSKRLGWDFHEGDSLHPSSNIAKMASGIPLDDTDRLPWLSRIADLIDQSQSRENPAIITCSALKRSYRDKLRRQGVTFVHLSGNPTLIERRMSLRTGHFMPTALLSSQLDALEPLEADEQGFTVSIDQPLEQQIEEIVANLAQ